VNTASKRAAEAKPGLYRIIVTLPGESRGRAYTGLARRAGRVTGIKRQRPGLGSAPAYLKHDADEIAAELRRIFGDKIGAVNVVREPVVGR
jgi:hypothetical protein